MPKSAISEGVVDAILSPVQMANEIEKLGSQRHLLHAVLSPEGLDEKQQKTTPEKPANSADISGILQLLRNATGVDFMHYKETTIRRRIIRRMVLYKLDSLPDYLEHIRKTPGEIQLLYKDLLINVTSFFRDIAATEYVQKEVIPNIIKNKPSNNFIRAWVPACSTGEEAYSLAILIMEVLGENAKNTAVQVFASDLSDAAITKARLGVYSVSDVSGVSAKRLTRFFTQMDGHYRIIKSIRDICVFAPHNVFKDPPFSRIDLISCCNLLIYLDTDLQARILSNFHYALVKEGFLILGKSETVGNSVKMFSQLDKKFKIYTRKDVDSRAVFEPRGSFSVPEKPGTDPSKNILPVPPVEKINLEKLVDSIFLSTYTPPAVVITHDMDIVQFRGATGLFLEPSPGKASLNLLKMARSGLALELRNGVQKVLKTAGPFKKSGIELTYQGSLHLVNFEVIPLNTHSFDRYLLIVFEEEKVAAAPETKAAFSKDRRAKQLEAEIIALREDMRSIVEEQESANEELQSANEEIVSSNEELQSINEELETSKEEVESTNEELMTINQELMMRNEQLAEEQDYTEAIIATIRESVLVLDINLRVKTANRAFYNTFKVKESETQGRSIYELGTGQWNIPELKKMFESLQSGNTHFHGYKVKSEFEGVGEKILLLNIRKITKKLPSDHFILVAIEDITVHQQNEKLLEEREAWLRNMSDNVPVMIWVAGADKNFHFLNKTWLAFTGRTLLQETGIGWIETIHPDDLEQCLTTFNGSFDERMPFHMEYRMERHDKEYRWILNKGVPTYNSSDEFTGFTGSCVEIHDKRVMNDELESGVKRRTLELQEANTKLERSNSELEQFAYVASHDLQEPLRKIITFSNRLSTQHKDLLADEAQELLKRISHSSERMRALINDLLNLSMISRSKEKFAPVDLNKTLRQIMDDLDLMIQEKKALIHSSNLPVIKGIEPQIQQLFSNLLGNALKFSRDVAPVEIVVDCRELTAEDFTRFPALDPAREYFEIRFRDNGIGFNPEFAGQIFTIFQRLHENSTFPGTGIGLAICRKIVDNHNGIIYAEGKENEGAMFVVLLPVEGGSSE